MQNPTPQPQAALPGNRAEIFLDYWNFRRAWNYRLDNTTRIDFEAFRDLVLRKAEAALGLGAHDLFARKTTLYASMPPRSHRGPFDREFIAFLDSVGRLEGFHVFKAVRPVGQPTTLRCSPCRTEAAYCSVCGRGFLHSPEKKVDVALATDLVRSSLRGKIDVACLVSADADFVPAVQAARDTGVAVVGVLWENQESSLAGCCSAVVRVSVDDMEQHGVANRP